MRIISFDPQKKTIKAYFKASNGLTGEGRLGGIYNVRTKAITFFGTTNNGLSVLVSGTHYDKTINANYTIGNKKVGIQKGTLSVSQY